MRWTLEKGPALTRYDPVPPFRLVYQGPRKLGGTYELHDHEAHWTLASARTQGKGTDHPVYEIWDDTGKLVERGEQDEDGEEMDQERYQAREA